MKIIASLTGVLLLIAAVAASAADLTSSDYAYLANHWGLKQDGAVVRNLTVDQQARLHVLIDDSDYRDRPQTIENQVGDYIFKVETCSDWDQSRGPCPNAPSSKDPPGTQIADRSCASCHLVGTASAPSFFKLARSGGWTADRLGAALRAGHEMSPVTLSDAELIALADYIASLK
jgi:hypothetical protein